MCEGGCHTGRDNERYTDRGKGSVEGVATKEETQEDTQIALN
jgi:hypothetical protein